MKRMETLLGLVCLAALALPCAAQDNAAAQEADTVCYAIGDANCNGDVTIADASIVQTYFRISGGILECPEQLDFNGDCVIDWDDYLLLMACYDPLEIPEFPDTCGPIATCCDPLYNSSCCVQHTGNADGEGLDTPTIGDISVLVDFLFLNRNPSSIGCVFEADVNQSGGCTPTYDDITIGDIAVLIDVLFVCSEGCSLPACLMCP